MRLRPRRGPIARTGAPGLSGSRRCVFARRGGRRPKQRPRSAGNSTQSASLIDEALHVDGVDSTDRSFSASDFYDLGEVLAGGFAQRGLAVAAGIVLFIDQEVDAALFRQKADGLAGVEAFRAAGLVLFPVLAELEVAGDVDDLAADSDGFALKRFAVNRSADSSGGPFLFAFFAEGSIGLVKVGVHLRLKRARRGFLGFSFLLVGGGEREGQGRDQGR